MVLKRFFLIFLFLFVTGLFANEMPATIDGMKEMKTLEVGELVDNKDLAGSYKILSGLYSISPSSQDINFNLGRVAFELKKYDEAISAFERVLIVNPANMRARLELARTYFITGAYSESKMEFKTVLVDNPPVDVKTNIEHFLTKIDELETRVKIDGNVLLGFQYDSNTKNSHGNNEYNVFTSPSTQVALKGDIEDSDFSAYQVASINYFNDIKKRGDFYTTFSALAYNQNYKDFTDGDIIYLKMAAGIGFLGEIHNYLVPFSFEKLWYGGTDYLNILGLGLNITHPLENGNVVSISLNHKQKEYQKTVDTNRDSVLDQLTFGYSKKMKTDTYLFNMYYEKEKKDDSNSPRIDIDMNMYGLRLAYVKSLRDAIDFYSHISYKKYSYKDMNSQFQNKREDDYLNVNISLSKTYTKYKNITTTLSYDYIDSGSNQSPYEYSKHLMSFNANYPFSF